MAAVNLAQIAIATGGTVTERAVAILIAAGITSSAEIAQALGINPRAVQKARKATRERPTGRVLQDAKASHRTQSVPQDASHRTPDVPQTFPAGARDNTTRANIESLRDEESVSCIADRDSSNGEGLTRGEGSPRVTARAGKAYAFTGEIIHVTERDFAKWREAYPHIADLTAELRLADAYYGERPEKLPGGKWFFAVSRWLDRANKEAQAAKKTEEVNCNDPYYARMVRLGMSRSEYERTYPPEIYRGLQ